MEAYNIITVIIVVTALFSFINTKLLKLPSTIGIMLMSLIASLAIIGFGFFKPDIFHRVTALISSVDFTTVLMKEMLSFLLFAGAIHINLSALKKERAAIMAFSTFGVFISTFIIGSLSYKVSSWLGLDLDFLPCLLFGALISPTDPIAVLGILKQSKIPSSLEMKISGESLFNDGVSVVVFTTIYEVMHSGMDQIHFTDVGWMFLKEAGGGLLLGSVLGYIGYYSVRSVNNYMVEILITLAIVMGGSYIAERLHISTLLAMVVAGIITGNKSMQYGMSDTTKDYVNKFWEMIDEVFNAVLFLLIGFEMMIVPFSNQLLLLGCIAIVITLFARFVSVAIPVYILKYKKAFEKNAVLILTWGGLRGGISIALALSLPASEHKPILVSVTYMIVLFSILVQGLTIGKLANKLTA